MHTHSLACFGIHMSTYTFKPNMSMHEYTKWSYMHKYTWTKHIDTWSNHSDPHMCTCTYTGIKYSVHVFILHFHIIPAATTLLLQNIKIPFYSAILFDHYWLFFYELSRIFKKSISVITWRGEMVSYVAWQQEFQKTGIIFPPSVKRQGQILSHFSILFQLLPPLPLNFPTSLYLTIDRSCNVR